MNEEKKPADFCTIREAARRGPLSEIALRRMAARNELPGYRSGTRYVVNYAELLRTIDQMRGEQI